MNGLLSEAVKGKSVDDLSACDDALKQKDGTELKKNLGGNAITACSFAIAVAGANVAEEELFMYLARQFGTTQNKFTLPTPMANILNGGKHAGGKLKIQEFMIVPAKNQLFSEQIRKVFLICCGLC